MAAAAANQNDGLPKYVYCLPWFFAVCATVLVFVGTACHFVQFTSANGQVDDLTTGEPQPLSLQFGLWYYQSYQIEASNSTVLVESCTMYPTTVNVDKNWKAARSLNIIAMILGGSVLFLDMFQGCMSTKRNRSFRMGSVGYFLSFLAAALSLLLLQSNVCKNNTMVEQLNEEVPGLQFPDTCSISRGGKATIAATVLFFVAAVGTAALHPIQKKEERQTSDEGLDEPLFGSDHGDASML